MVTARPEVLAGSYIADTNQLVECTSQQSALITIPVPSVVSLSSNSLAMLVFLNGMRTQAWLFNFKLQQPVLDANRGLLNVTVLTNAIYPIETLFLSYLIIDLSKLGSSFTYAFTTASQPGDFTLSGLVALTNSTSGQLQSAYISLNKTNRLSCTGFTCSNCISASSCTSNSGVVVGNQCVKCGINQVFQAGIGCVCASGYYMINGGCGTCSQGAIYVPVSQSCLSCGNNAGPFNGACACNTGFYNISGSCQSCSAGTTYSALLLNCVSVCSGGQQWTNGACTCPGNTYLISSSCGTCPVGYSYNSATSTCSQICTLANQVYINGQCNCAQGYALISGGCTLTSSLNSGSCGASQILLNGVCKCLPNFVQYQGNCYPCPANSVATVDQSGCVCNPGYNLTSLYTCVLASTSAGSISSSLSTSNNQVVATSSTSNLATSTSTTTNTSPSSVSVNSASSGPVSSGSISSSTTTNGVLSSSSSASLPTTYSGTSTSTFGTITSASGSTLSSGSNIISSTGSNTINSGSNTITTSSTTSSLSGAGSTTQSTSSCPLGMFQSGTTCQQCSTYCLSCFTNSICINCSAGFQLVQSPSTTSYSNACVPASPSVLISVLQRVGIVNAIYQNVMISYLPSALTANGCPNCRYILNATLVAAPTNSTIESNYILGTQYQYVVTAITPNTLSTGTLTFTLQLNSTLSNFFSPADMAQKQTVVVDLSTVSMYAIQSIGVTNSAISSQDYLGGEGSKSNASNLGKALKYFANNS